MDAGHIETEAILARIEQEIYTEYSIAEAEVRLKLEEYFAKFAKKDELKRKALAHGLITQAEYDQWLVGQVMMGLRWEELRESLAIDMANAEQIASSIVFGYMPEVYALNHNYGTFQVEKASLIDTSYTLYDRQTVETLMKDAEGRFIPAPGKKLREKINREQVIAWNEKNIQSEMLQAILQGENIGKLATRLANYGDSIILEDIKKRAKMAAEEIADELARRNRSVSIRNARTMTTGVQNAGRIASYDRASAMGIQVQKQWLATLDGRTRHWHRELDGVRVDNDKPFENDFGEIMFPGDPTAHPANIYNCRCTLVASIKGFEHDMSDLSERRNEKLGDMTYEEWKESKESYSDPITKQDEIAAYMKRLYGAEYHKYSKLPEKG